MQSFQVSRLRLAHPEKNKYVRAYNREVTGRIDSLYILACITHTHTQKEEKSFFLFLYYYFYIFCVVIITREWGRLGLCIYYSLPMSTIEKINALSSAVCEFFSA